MYYAVNLADLTARKDDLCLKMLLVPVVDLDAPIVEVERDRFDGMGIKLNCTEGRGAAIVSILRQKFKRHKLRLYESKTGRKGWKRI
jgi:hypothetical protein